MVCLEANSNNYSYLVQECIDLVKTTPTVRHIVATHWLLSINSFSFISPLKWYLSDNHKFLE